MGIHVMLPFHCKQRLSSTVAVWLLIVCGLWLGCGRDQGASDAIVSEEPILSIFTPSLFGVDFIDRDKGWAVGKLGGVIHTDDGGKNWWAEKSGIDVHLFDVCFADAQNGWAVGDMGSIIHTGDGGKNWNSQKSGAEHILRGVTFTDSNRGWVVGDEATMLTTENGGKEWKLQDGVKATLSPRKKLFLPALLDITFADEKRGWAVGYPGIILHTGDGGETWAYQESGTEEVLNCVSFVDGNRGLIAGNRGIILRTEDGGGTWVSQESGVMVDLLGVVTPDLQNAWAVTYGSILHSGDGGQSWVAQESEVGHWFYNLAFPDAAHGWAVGDFGVIYHTSDAGESWTVQTAKLSSEKESGLHEQ